MDLLFNKNNAGQTELKKVLGFLDGNFTYTNLETDIKLNTPYIIALISKEVYQKLANYYKAASPTTDEKIDLAIEYVQIYIASMAYLDFTPNNALTHSNSGRNVELQENSKMAWDWQIAQDNAATKKRAYKALDHLFILLNEADWDEWKTSDAYKKANSLFIKNTLEFDDVFPINKSGQLYYRMVSFMDDYEKDQITSILTANKVTELKTAETPDQEQKDLLIYVKKSIAYLTLAKAYKTLPVEMFPEGLIYQENTKVKAESRAEVMLFLDQEGKSYLTKLEYEYAKQQQTYTEQSLTNGLTEGKKYINL